MSNTTGIKGAGVDVARRLQRAAEAIVTPKTLGAEGLEAFKTLRVLDNLASLLPPQWQGITKALIGLGISNVGQHAEPQAKDAVRGYTSMLAIKSGRVPADVVAQAAGPQQKQALIDAAARGDTATVKSILRHNKKAGTPASPASASPVSKPPVTQSPVTQSPVIAAGSDRPKKKDAGIVPEKGTPLELKRATTRSIEADRAAGLPFEKVLLNFMERLVDDLGDQAKKAKDATTWADLKARREAGKAHFAGQPGHTLSDLAGNPVHVNTDAKTATRLNRDGSETVLKGKALGDFLIDLERVDQATRDHAMKRRGPPTSDDLEMIKMLAKLREALMQGAS